MDSSEFEGMELDDEEERVCGQSPPEREKRLPATCVSAAVPSEEGKGLRATYYYEKEDAQ